MPIDSRNSIYFWKFRISNTVERLLDVAQKSDTAQVFLARKWLWRQKLYVVKRAGVTKQQNTDPVKNQQQKEGIGKKFFLWMLLCDYLKGFLILTTLSSEFWHELQWHLEIRFVSWRKLKNLLNSERVKRIPNKNCQKVFQKPRMRWISVKLPLGERTRPCMLACFESPTQKHKHSTDSKQQKSNIFSLAFLASCRRIITRVNQ